MLNPSKCETSFFSTDTKEEGWCPEVRLNGITLPINRTPKFLGITYYRTLTFHPHVEEVKSKVLGVKEYGWSCGRICLAMINSVLNYCGAAWLAKTNFLILERVRTGLLVYSHVRYCPGMLEVGCYTQAPVQALRRVKEESHQSKMQYP